MPIGGKFTFGKKPAPAAPPQQQETPAAPAPETQAPAPAPTGAGFGKKAPAAPAPGAAPTERHKPSFLRGAAAKKEFDRADRKDQERREKAGSLFRFFIGTKGKMERRILFLDGDLDADGLLDIPYFYEHRVPHDNSWENFRCLEGIEASCPLCEAGSDRSYVGALTVLEIHDEPWIDRDGKPHNYSRRLYVAKLMTLKKLQAKATKMVETQGTKGLAGCIFDVSRTGKRDAAVGSDFDFVRAVDLKTDAEFQAWLEKPEHGKPCDYENDPGLRVLSGKELLDAGVGKAAAPAVGSRAASGQSIDDELE